MSGFGIRESWEASLELSPVEMHRPSSFLYQLSANGSLLLSANHDELWLGIVHEITGSDLRWSQLRERLRSTPASTVRRLLYRAGCERLEVEARRLAAAQRLCLQTGVESALVESLGRRVEAGTRLAAELSWCAADTDRSRIETIP